MHFPVSIDVLPSRRLRAALVLVHLAAILAVLVADLAWLALPVMASFLLSMDSVWRRVAVVSLRLSADGSLEWLMRDGRMIPGKVLSGSCNLGWLVVLRVRLEGEQRLRVAVVLADCLPGRHWRYLQVWMRWIARFRNAADAA